MDEIIKKIQSQKANYKGKPFQDYDGFINKLDGYIADFRERLKSGNNLISVYQLFKEERKGKQFFQHNEFCRMTEFSQYNYPDNFPPGGLVNDYKGVYIFCKQFHGKIYPVYIGISQRISQRLRGHLFGKDKGTATWFYRMAKCKNHDRPFATKKAASDALVKMRNEWHGGLMVMAYPIKGDYELALAEIYMASKLKVYWNSFETH